MKIPLLILLIVACCVFIIKFYGKSGVIYTILFLGLSWSGDAIQHFLGPVALAIYLSCIIALAIRIYILQRRRRNPHDLHKHHPKTRDDHVA